MHEVSLARNPLPAEHSAALKRDRHQVQSLLLRFTSAGDAMVLLRML